MEDISDNYASHMPEIGTGQKSLGSSSKFPTPNDLLLPNGTTHTAAVERGTATSQDQTKVEIDNKPELPLFTKSVYISKKAPPSDQEYSVAEKGALADITSQFERVILSKTDELSSAQFAERLEEIHAKGRIAIHMTPSPTMLYDRLDDKRILNNLREDGGTDERREGYQLYQTLSTTLLPKAQDPIKQQVYTVVGTKFVTLDVENTRVKSLCGGDAQAKYGVKNRSGRPSYKATGRVHDISDLSYERTMHYVDKMNQHWTDFVTKPQASRLFGQREPGNIRGMNESLLKVNSKSLLSIGTLASLLKQKPQLLLELIQDQKEILDKLGVVYPISIYNNDNEPIVLDMLGDQPIEIAPNQFQQIDIKSCLSQLRKAYPDEASYKSFYKTMDYSVNEQGEAKIPTEAQMRAEAKKIRADLKAKIADTLLTLEAMLPKFTRDEGILVVNRENKVQASPDDKYEEINQENLKRFIKDKVLKLPEGHEITQNDQERINAFAKAYNLQYRLHVYAEIAEKPNAILNHATLKEDLHWADKLRPLL